MASIIIHTDNKKDLSFLQEMADKMGFKSQVLDEEWKEDIVLANAIQENDPAENLTLQEAKEYYKSFNFPDK